MKTIILLLFASTFTFGAAPAFAQAIPRNMFDHLYWESTGNYINQFYAAAGLSNLGYINDTITHAIAVGENYTIPLGEAAGPVRAAFIRDRFTLDTSRIYEFPGTNVLPANLNGDPWKDYVCFSALGNLTVLLGTPKIDSFVIAFSLKAGSFDFGGYNIMNEVLVHDFDSDGFDDIIVDEAGTGTGYLFYYRGGVNIDSTPSMIIKSTAQQLAVGHVKDTSTMYLVTYNHPGIDSVYIYTIPLGKDFKFKATDSIICNVDSGGADDGGFALADVYGRNIEDIIIGGINAFVFKGGTTISGTPTFIFHHPSYVPYDLGRIILDAGDISGHGYHYLLFADYEALGDEGAIYLYPIGKGLKDSCVAYAAGLSGFEDYFGVTAIAPGDVNGDGIADVVVGYDGVIEPQHAGRIVVLLGDPSYGDSIKTGIEPQMNIPQLFSLSQNFPNPCMRTSQINFIVNESKFYGKELTITLYDFDGKEREILYHGTADAVEHAIPIDGTTLPAGIYFYELSCNNWHLRKTMTIVK